jgi:hypothetical protein
MCFAHAQTHVSNRLCELKNGGDACFCRAGSCRFVVQNGRITSTTVVENWLATRNGSSPFCAPVLLFEADKDEDEDEDEDEELEDRLLCVLLLAAAAEMDS